MIKETSIQLIRDADIVSVIQSRIPIKKNGAGYKACCPFHTESTPSFTVSATKQIFKCFGCGEAGNVISFVMKHDNISYIDAVKKIASEEKIELEFTENTNYDKELYQAQQTAKENFRIIQSEFTKEVNKGIDYFMTRNLSEQTCKDFGIGFCDNTEIKNDFTREYKLTNEKNNYSFYNRATIPICDRSGNVISFAGRNLTGEEPKYINGANTDLYKKDSVLYNLHNALSEIRNKSEIIICEGYFDVMALHNAGHKNSVAVGSANITDEQIKIIENLKIEGLRVIMCLDNDVKDFEKVTEYKKKHPTATVDEIKKYSKSNAGQDGTVKAIPRLLHFSEVKNIELRDFKDVGDYAIKFPKKVQELIDTAQDSVTWLCEKMMEDKTSPYEIFKAQEQCAKIISKIQKENIRSIYIKINATVLGTTIKELRTLINEILNIKDEIIDLTNLEYVKVADNYYKKIIDFSVSSETYGTRYDRRSKEELNEEKYPNFTKKLPRFDGFTVIPNHINYQPIISHKFHGLSNTFLNSYHELTHKPKPFEYDTAANYEDIPEIKTIAMFFNHIADNKKYGMRFVNLLWDYVTVMYKHPTRKLQALCLVSKDEGTGKSKFIELMLEIFGANSTPISTERLTKNFNSLIAGKILCTIEESKDQRNELENFLKEFITGQSLIVEKKGIDSQVVENFAKLMIASNHPEQFLKVSSGTTRYAVLYVPKVEKKDNNLLEKMISEIPYFLHVIKNRAIKCPDTDRLWFDPKVWENEALNKLRQASKDVVIKSLEDLFENIFIKTEVTDPLIRFSAESLKQMMISFVSGKYNGHTSNFFSDVCREKMNLHQSNSAVSFDSLKIMIADTSNWEYECVKNKTRYVEIPIWKFVKAETVTDTFQKEKLEMLIKSFTSESFKKTVVARYDVEEVNLYLNELKGIQKIMSIESIDLVTEQVPY